MTTPADTAPGTTEQFMTVKEMADRLRVSKMTVYRLLHHGSIPCVRFGRSFRIHRTEANAYIRNSIYPPPSPGPQA